MTIEKPLVLFCRVTIIVLVGIISLTGAGAPLQELIVRCSIEQLRQLQNRHGAAILEAIPGSDVYLIALPSRIDPSEIKAVDNTILAGPNFELGIDEPSPRPGSTGRLPLDMVPFYTSNVPRFYLEQPPAANIELLQAHRLSTGKRSVVALIDTGIDETHPVLQKIIGAGKNYVTPGAASEWNDPALDQLHSTVFRILQSQSTVFDLRAPIVPFRGIINALFAGSAFPAAPLPAAFGHGTMTAGIVHLVAPDAELMPMKAFDADGKASLWNLIRAVRDSVDFGADVINMANAGPTDMKAARLFKILAVDYAAAANVVLVAGAGNRNQDTEVSTAAIDSVNTIAAVDSHDVKAAFSNYGTSVAISAPGTDVISTYPGTFASASGTSFSAPFVSGIYALLREAGSDRKSDRAQIERGSDSIERSNDVSLKDKLGKGRINALKTVSHAVLTPFEETR